MKIQNDESRTYSQKVAAMNIEINLIIQRIGNGILGIIKGPNAHLGAVSMSEPYNKAERVNSSACVSTISQYGHQDTEITRKTAYRLGKSLNCVVVIAGGLHVDQLSKKGISAILLALDEIITSAIEDLSDS